MRWNVTPRRSKPNSGRWKADRTEYARRPPPAVAARAPEPALHYGIYPVRIGDLS